MSSFKKDENLNSRIDNALAKKGNENKNNNNNQTLVNTFSRVATELLAGLLVGAGIGWTLDKWLNTNPWFLILFFFARWSCRNIKSLESCYWQRPQNRIFLTFNKEKS